MSAIETRRFAPRWVVTPALGLLITFLLFLLMGWIIRGDEGAGFDSPSLLTDIEILQPEPPAPDQQDAAKNLLDNAPPPPPAAPPSLGRPDLPALNVPALALDPTPIGNITVPVALGASGLSLGKAGQFGGFGSGGSGTGGGGGGGGGGAGWKGKPLVPLSTARPQMPDWACKQKLNGWVEAVFVVMPNGRVQDIRITDADPKGVFEAAAIESISNWLYEPTGKAAEVKQRVPMDHEDCQYNWR